MRCKVVLCVALALSALAAAVSWQGTAIAGFNSADPAIAIVGQRYVAKKTFIDLAVMNADGSNRTVILSTENWTQAGGILESSWSPDLDPVTPGYQGSLVFDTSSPDAIWVIEVNVTPSGVQGSEPRPLDTRTDFGIWSPAWSPRGDLIAYNAGNAIGEGGIYVVPTAGGTPTLIVPWPDPLGLALYPTWSPDGTHIAYWWEPSGSGDFASLVVKQVVDPSTGNLMDGPATTLIAKEVGFTSLFYLDWSRFGDRIAFQGHGFKRTPPLYIFNVTSGSIQEVPSTAGDRSPTWSPDDRFLVYSEGGKIVRQELATGVETVVAVAATKKGSLHFPDWRRVPSAFDP